jgi:hypothetical protein
MDGRVRLPSSTHKIGQILGYLPYLEESEE